MKRPAEGKCSDSISQVFASGIEKLNSLPKQLPGLRGYCFKSQYFWKQWRSTFVITVTSATSVGSSIGLKEESQTIFVVIVKDQSCTFSFQNFKACLYPICPQSHTIRRSMKGRAAWINEQMDKSLRSDNLGVFSEKYVGLQDLRWSVLCACMHAFIHMNVRPEMCREGLSSSNFFFIVC